MSVDWPDYQTPQAHATAISITGVPLLHNPSNLNGATPITVNAGVSNQVTPLNGNNVNFMGALLSYEIRARFTSNSASVLPFLTFIVTWSQDAAATVILYRERWTFAANALSGGTSIVGAGPVRGAYMQMSVTNEDTVNAITINGLFVTVGSRPFPNLSPDWRTLTPNLSIPSFTVPQFSNGDDGILGIFNIASQAASSILNLCCGCFNGQVQLSVTVTAGTAPSLTVTPSALVSGSGVIDGIGGQLIFSSLTSKQETVFTPRSNLILVANNTSANTVQYSVAAVAASQF